MFTVYGKSRRYCDGVVDWAAGRTTRLSMKNSIMRSSLDDRKHQGCLAVSITLVLSPSPKDSARRLKPIIAKSATNTKGNNREGTGTTRRADTPPRRPRRPHHARSSSGASRD